MALAHVRAVTTPAASNTRFLITPGAVTSQEIADILRKNFKELGERVPKGVPGSATLDPEAYGADSGPIQKVLGIQFTDKEKTFVDLGANLLKIEKSESKA